MHQKTLFYSLRVLLALILVLSLLFSVACGENGSSLDGESSSGEESSTDVGTDTGDRDTTNGSTAEEDTTAPVDETTAEAGDNPVDGTARPLQDGTVIYYEGFDGYKNTSSNDETFALLRDNGVWKLDDKTDPYYKNSAPYASKSTCLYEIKDGKLHIMGQKDANGNTVSGATDTYLVIVDEATLWELDGVDYTIQYDVSYESFTNVKRYIALLWNYYGQYYNSFHLRVNGTGNLQLHGAGNWLDMDAYEASLDLCSTATDNGAGSSIAKKLLGIDLGGSSDKTVFKNVSVTVRIRISENGEMSVWMRVNRASGASDFIEVARYSTKSELGTNLNPHTALARGGALCLKTGAGINGTVDNILVYVGHGEEPTDKTVHFVPAPLPENGTGSSPDGFLFTQESAVLNNEYTDSAYTAFNADFDPSYLVPALHQGMIPQGMDVWEEKNWLLISGYFKDTLYSSSSVLVAIDLTSGEYVGEYYLKNADGSNHTSHAGGLAVTDKNIYIANGNNLYRIPLSDVEAVGKRGDIRICEVIATPTRASFCNYSGGYLWVGDFYIPSNATYDTPEWRHMVNNVGATYGAWCVGYKITDATESGFSDTSWKNGMEYAIPDVVLSIDQKIQGFAVVSDDTIALSQSYGRTNNSKIYLYDNVLSDTPHRTVSLGDREIPVYFLDAKIDCKTYTALPMSEGLAVYKGKLLILFESGASYYKDDGGKNPTDRVFVMKNIA